MGEGYEVEWFIKKIPDTEETVSKQANLVNFYNKYQNAQYISIIRYVDYNC